MIAILMDSVFNHFMKKKNASIAKDISEKSALL